MYNHILKNFICASDVKVRERVDSPENKPPLLFLTTGSLLKDNLNAPGFVVMTTKTQLKYWNC